nr:Fe-S cluster assembly protein HesB [Microbacterium bovistercoris]
MLTLTENAATAVKSIVSNDAEVDTAGLRIHTADDPAQGFALSVAPAPESEDAVVEEAGARVFLDAGATVALDDQVLDAQVGDDGAVRFGLAMQS